VWKVDSTKQITKIGVLAAKTTNKCKRNFEYIPC